MYLSDSVHEVFCAFTHFHSFIRPCYLLNFLFCSPLWEITCHFVFHNKWERAKTVLRIKLPDKEQKGERQNDAIKIQLAQRQRGRDVKFGLEERIQKGWGIQLSPLWQVHVSNWGSLSSISSQKMWWENEVFLINAVIMMGPTVDLCPFRMLMNVPGLGVKVGLPDSSAT